jgi:hypothetical protein
LQVGAHAWENDAYQAIAQLRGRRREFGYAHRATLGKWEYWVASVSFLVNLVEAAIEHKTDATISDNASKCALRFLDQR